jgi:UMP-CMP kinase
MKIRVGTSILLLLQARASTTAFSSSLSSRLLNSKPAPFTLPSSFVVRGGSSISNTRATVSSEETINSNNDFEQDVRDEITNAAMNAIDITGPSTYIDNFAGIPFVNTSKLNALTSQTTDKNQHRVLFVLGGPGAGKGTQSEKIVNEYKCIHLSVGELLRNERQRGDESPHAELIESCLVAGKIVPVEISLGLLRNAMDEAVATTAKCNYGQPIFLVDGFPRNYDNLSGWTANMPNYASCIGSLVYDCSMDVLEKRILSRAATSGRSDDNLESARKRFKTFQQQTMPVVHALEEVEQMQKSADSSGNSASRLHIQHIVGEGSVSEVWDMTKDALNGYVKNDVLSANASLLQAIEAKDIQTYAALTSIELIASSQDKGKDIDINLEGVVKDNVVTSNEKVDMGKVEKAFKSYELIDGCADGVVSRISNAKVEVRSGTKAVVSYDQQIEDKATGEMKSEFRESRVWSHEGKGWVCIHFVRTPLSEQ